jgi:hypothetical protein
LNTWHGDSVARILEFRERMLFVKPCFVHNRCDWGNLGFFTSSLSHD